MPKAEFNIVIIGSGNMAWAMGRLFSKNHRIVQVVSRNEKTGKKLAKKLETGFSNDIKNIYSQADFYLLCVPDDEVNRVARQIKHVSGIRVHHSGALPLTAIPAKQRAVLYPFVSVNSLTDLNKKKLPLYYNSDSKTTAFMLQSLMQGLKCDITLMNDRDRLKLHLAGVLVNNFTNHLYDKTMGLAGKIPGAHDALTALARQALEQFRQQTSHERQTGPARRNDRNTQKKHLDLIKKDPELKGIYLSLSRSIHKTYHS